MRRTLGSGGMGIVLLAFDEGLAREVAVKLVHPHLLKDPSVRASFLEEARAMARVRHPNVVEIFAFGDHDDRPFFTMEYVPGPSLDAFHARRDHGPMPLIEVLRILDDVAAGLDAIHEYDTAHGDLKPGNILVGPDNQVQVADFGLTVKSDVFAGTPSYLAPEQIAGSADPGMRSRGDIYSLGVVAHELLTGRRPFVAPDVGRIYAQHLYKPPPRVTALRPDLPVEIDAVVASALRKDPHERTRTARELVDGLRRVRRAMRPTRRVLIADDDEDFRALVRACLEEELTVDTIDEVNNGRDALNSLRSRHFDLAIVDLHMPRMNGLELTASIREQISRDELRIVVVTGHGTASDWRVLSQLQADAFLVKPVEPDALISTVEPLLYG